MRSNGYIYIMATAAEELNEYGEPILAEPAWGEPIAAEISANSDSRLGRRYEDGRYRQAAYTIYIEGTDNAPALNTRIRVERRGEQLGEYETLTVEPLPQMGRTRIII